LEKSWLGWAEIEPREDVIAGSYRTWKLTYHVGRLGIDDGGSIRVAMRNVSNMESPQFTDFQASGFTTISSTGDVRLETSFSDRGHIRPFRRALQVDVRDGSLSEGDEIIIILGDDSWGSPGIRVQTFREEEHIFKILVDAFRTGRFEEITNSPKIRIRGGPAERIEIATPSQIKTGTPFRMTVRALDTYGNRSDGYRGKITIEMDNTLLVEEYTFTEEDCGAHTFEGIRVKEKGIKRIKVKDDQGREAESNPIMFLDEEPELKLFWGDMHGQTKQTVGTGSLDEYFSFLREVADMDFGSWQGNDFQITNELWKHVGEEIDKHHKPGRLVLFRGYEWSGLTPAGGDHNIYFLGEGELHRSNHWLIDDRTDEETDRYPIFQLWEEFRERGDVMAIPHVGGRHANLDYYDEEMIPLIEVHSHHGTFEWFLKEALKRKLKVGFIAASDDHTCRLGLTLPSETFTTKGGYTGVYAKELTREGLWDAFWARRCYGTTGKRIILDFKINGHWMGEEIDTEEYPEISVRVCGTAPIHQVEVYKGIDPIHRYFPVEIDEADDKLIKIEWMGARVKSRTKRVNWDGGLYLDKGRILTFKKYSFDYPDQDIRKVNNQRIEWDSTTGGDADGVLLKMDAPEDAILTFYTREFTFKFQPSEITQQPQIKELGDVNKKIIISAIPDVDLPKEVEFTYIDGRPLGETTPYWVKVTQSDGELAWSSPIYVNHVDKTT
jgi:hypothetical protein